MIRPATKRREAFNIPNIYNSLRRKYLQGTITISEASWRIYRAGLRNSPPGEFETLKMLGIY